MSPARERLIDFLHHRARPFLFSTSHPPAVAAACLAAIDVLENEPQLIERLWDNTRFFKSGLQTLGFNTGASESPITPVIVGDAALAMKLSDALFQEGVFAQGIGFPTVARDKARVRTIVTATHTRDELQFALDCFRKGGAIARRDLRFCPARGRDDNTRYRDAGPHGCLWIVRFALPLAFLLCAVAGVCARLPTRKRPAFTGPPTASPRCSIGSSNFFSRTTATTFPSLLSTADITGVEAEQATDDLFSYETTRAIVRERDRTPLEGVAGRATGITSSSRS